MTRKVIIICAGICAATTLAAQEQAKDSTLNRTVVVENQYNPESTMLQGFTRLLHGK